MPRPAKGARLGSGPAHERLLLAGLAAALIDHERIRTTEAKARRLRPVAERLITLGKRGSVHARRQALSVIGDRDIVHKLFADVSPRYEGRDGGYTRILKLGTRKGDGAAMALIELVEGVPGAPAEEPEAKRRRGVLRRRRAKGAEAAPEPVPSAAPSEAEAAPSPAPPEVEPAPSPAPPEVEPAPSPAPPEAPSPAPPEVEPEPVPSAAPSEAEAAPSPAPPEADRVEEPAEERRPPAEPAEPAE